jgi:two-component system NtrC family sensor kinase
VHRGLGGLLDADLGFVWRLGRTGSEAAYHMRWTPRGDALFKTTRAASLREQALRLASKRKTPEDAHLLFLLVESMGRPSGVMAFLRPGRRFGRRDAAFGMDVMELLGRALAHREQARTYEIRERIVRKVLLQVRPADVLYQVLHGLKRLLRYDHSASVLTFGADGKLCIRAEVIAWTKAKSTRVGGEILLAPDEARYLSSLIHPVEAEPDRLGKSDAAALADRVSRFTEGVPPSASVLLAPLRRHEGVAGLLVLRAVGRDAFVEADRQTIDSFLDIISATALHSEHFRHQQDLLLAAERRVGLADMARAISHDLNNALGVIQPLLETLLRDFDRGTLNQEILRRDLNTLSDSVGLAVRVLRGLLSFSRGALEPPRAMHLADCLQAVLGLLERGLHQQGIEVITEIPADLPQLVVRRQDMEQLFLNLLSNARESMPSGGALRVSARHETDGDGGAIVVTISDTGYGIPPNLLARVFEPFFTTKQGGTGLGLDICRSIVWEYDGQLRLGSEEGKGTTATVRFPLGAGRAKAESIGDTNEAKAAAQLASAPPAAVTEAET